MDRRWCERQQVSWSVTLEIDTDRTIDTHARNITLEGMLIALDDSEHGVLSIGDEVMLHVEIPTEDGQPMRHSAPATVTHLRDRAAGMHFHCFSDHQCVELERQLYKWMYPEGSLHAA